MRNFCSLFYVLCIFFQVFFSMVAVAGDVSVRVAAGNSDAEERFDGKVSLTSSDLEMVFEKVGNQTVGIRFADISIPQGATISQAYIQFTVDEPTAESTTLLIEGELNANAAIFQSIYFDISSRSRTATNVLWSPAPWFNVGEAAADQRTPDISALVQEIIGQNDWLPGNAIAFIISGAGERVAESFNGKPEAAAQLFITFDGENINQAPQVDAGGDASITLPSTQLTLSGSVNDDGKPSNTLTTVWQHVGGTGVGDVSFADSALINTLATFSADPGTYVLRLTADDGELSAFSERTVVVNPVGLVWLEVPIISTADDAEQRSNGSISMSSSDLELVFEKTGNQVVGMRFQAINLPAQATVLNAYIQFTVDEISNNPTQLSIRGEANSAAAAFVKSDFNISARVTTNANVDWLPNPWLFVGAAGIEQRSPNLASIVQEILASPGWTPGNALVFIITGSGERVAESFDGVAAAAPRLFIEYSGEVVNTPPTVSAGTDATLVLPHNSITLQASASDDGLPTNNLSAMWMHSGGSGAGVVNFTNANQLQTTATFGNSPGTYHLQLAVSDGELTTTDRITITVHAGGEVMRSLRDSTPMAQYSPSRVLIPQVWFIMNRVQPYFWQILKSMK